LATAEAATEKVGAEPRREQAADRPLRFRLLALSAVLLLPLLIIGGWIAKQFTRHPRPNTREAASPNLRIVPVTTVSGSVQDPVFSPDGRQIAFVWDGLDRRHYDLYVQMVGGETPLRLTRTTTNFLGNPQWSPDGREIAFTWCGGTSEGIYLVPALGERCVGWPPWTVGTGVRGGRSGLPTASKC
jgi:hypothetical protein